MCLWSVMNWLINHRLSWISQDTLLQFSLVVERLHDAPVGYEAFSEPDHSLATINSSHAMSPRGISQFTPAGAAASVGSTLEE